MRDFIQKSIILFFLFFLRVFMLYGYIRLAALIVLLIYGFIFQDKNFQLEGFDSISIVVAVYIALNTVYYVQDEKIKILSHKFGIDPNKFKE